MCQALDEEAEDTRQAGSYSHGGYTLGEKTVHEDFRGAKKKQDRILRCGHFACLLCEAFLKK